jgi:hypothetical protein
MTKRWRWPKKAIRYLKPLSLLNRVEQVNLLIRLIASQAKRKNPSNENLRLSPNKVLIQHLHPPNRRKNQGYRKSFPHKVQNHLQNSSNLKVKVQKNPPQKFHADLLCLL